MLAVGADWQNPQFSRHPTPSPQIPPDPGPLQELLTGYTYFVQQKPIKVIYREFGLSRKVVRKVIRSDATE